MTIEQLVKNGNSNLQIVVGIMELKEFAIEIANEVLSAKIEKKTDEIYYTSEQTANRLQVDKSTLWRWNKAGYLSPIKVGGKIRYRESDIKKAMEG